MKPIGTNLTRDVKRSMFDYMPKMYEEIAETKALIETEAAELEILYERINDALLQFNIESATWGITAYEFDIDVIPNASKPLDQRKSVVISKLRGAGVTTRELIKNVAEAYANTDVEVTEDNSNYNIVVKFVGTYGVPPNMSDLERSLREIIPAHMVYTLVFTYVTYVMLNGKYADYNAITSSGLSYDDLLVN